MKEKTELLINCREIVISYTADNLSESYDIGYHFYNISNTTDIFNKDFNVLNRIFLQVLEP